MTGTAHKPGEPLTPEELGALFANMPDDEQAKFFNGVAAAVAEWPDNGGYSYGEKQWRAVRYRLLRDDNAEGMKAAQSMASWWLFHAWESTS